LLSIFMFQFEPISYEIMGICCRVVVYWTSVGVYLLSSVFHAWYIRLRSKEHCFVFAFSLWLLST